MQTKEYQKMLSFRVPDWLDNRLYRAAAKEGFCNVSDYLRWAVNNATASTLDVKPKPLNPSQKPPPNSKRT